MKHLFASLVIVLGTFGIEAGLGPNNIKNAYGLYFGQSPLIFLEFPLGGVIFNIDIFGSFRKSWRKRMSLAQGSQPIKAKRKLHVSTRHYSVHWLIQSSLAFCLRALYYRGWQDRRWTMGPTNTTKEAHFGFNKPKDDSSFLLSEFNSRFEKSINLPIFSKHQKGKGPTEGPHMFDHNRTRIHSHHVWLDLYPSMISFYMVYTFFFFFWAVESLEGQRQRDVHYLLFRNHPSWHHPLTLGGPKKPIFYIKNVHLFILWTTVSPSV